MPGPMLAVDIGGTKLAAATVTTTGRLLDRAQAPTTVTQDPQHLWRTLDQLLTTVLTRSASTAGPQVDPVGQPPVAGVGVGCGGPMDWPDGRVSPLNIPAWRGFPLRDRLTERFPGVPVRVHNDAVAFAVGEHWAGVGRGTGNFLGMVVSTGVGGGLVLANRVLDGASGNAGHVGHVVVESDGPPCACGGRGCLEAVARGPATVQWALAQGWQPPPGAPADGRSLVAAAEQGERAARAALARAGAAVGVAVASAAHLLELDAVAVGGGLANAGPLLLDPARESFRRHVRMPFAARCRIEPATLGPDAGLVGAAALVLAGDRYWAGD